MFCNATIRCVSNNLYNFVLTAFSHFLPNIVTPHDLKMFTQLFPVDNLMHMDGYYFDFRAIMLYMLYCFNFLPDYDNHKK